MTGIAEIDMATAMKSANNHGHAIELLLPVHRLRKDAAKDLRSCVTEECRPEQYAGRQLAHNSGLGECGA
jgi:hypothetical protein